MVKIEEVKPIKLQMSSLYGKLGESKMVPKEMEVTTKIGVTIIAASKTTLYKKYFETESLLSATRIVNTFKPKRYHKVVDVHFEEVGVLV